MLGHFCWFLKKLIFPQIPPGIPSECQTVWIQIGPTLSDLEISWNRHLPCITTIIDIIICLFWFYTYQSTAMVMSAQSVRPNHTFFPGQVWLTDNNRSWISEGRRMAIEFISWSISLKEWDRAGIELATPGSAVRHVTDCAMQPGTYMEKMLNHIGNHLIFSCPEVWGIRKYKRTCVFFEPWLHCMSVLNLGPNCLQMLLADDTSCC